MLYFNKPNNQNFFLLYSGQNNKKHHKSYLALSPTTEFISQNFTNLENFLDEAITNIRSDRAITSALLTDLVQEMKSSGSSLTVNQQCGLIASKYVETLQRSNEQLVKISAILQKKSSANEGLSSIEKEEIFDLIKNSEESEGAE